MRMILIMERKDKRYISCRVSGRLLIKCDVKCSIEIACIKCGSDIVAVVDNDMVIVLENRRSRGKSNRKGLVKISISKAKKSRLTEQEKKQ